MSLMVTAHLLDKHGPLMSIADLAQTLRLEEGTLRNKLSSREIDIPRSKQGRLVLFHVEDVAQYIDSIRPS